MRFDYPERYQTVDGLTVRYWDVGRGEPLLLVHGMGICVECWAWNMDALSARHRVVALDLPGCGKSSRPVREEVFSLQYGGEFLQRFAVALGIPTLNVAGHSMGGVLAIQLALMHPEMVRRLILVDSGGLGKEVHPGVSIMAVPPVNWLAVRPPRVFVRQAARQLFRRRDATTDELIERIDEYLRVPGTVSAALKMADTGVDLRGQTDPYTAAELGQIAAPTLVIWGEDDPVIPVRHAENALRAIPDCRAVAAAGAGHGPQIDRPELFNALVLEFLAAGRLAQEEGAGRRLIRV